MLESINQRILEQMEIDTIQISRNCPRGCRDCSQSPTNNYETMSLALFEKAVHNVCELEKATELELFTRYVLTSTDSDPFFHPDLYEILKRFKEMTGKRFYLLTSGWFIREKSTRKWKNLTSDNLKIWQKNAEAIAADPDVIESLTVTVKTSCTNPGTVEEKEDLLVNAIRTFRSFPHGKLMLTPQYVPDPELEPGKDDMLSASYVEKFVERILDRVGGDIRERLDEKIFYRPIIGLGRAVTKLGLLPVTPKEYRIEAEQPPPLITTPKRAALRPFSGMIAIDGTLKVLQAPRGRLYREMSAYLPLQK